MNLQKLITEKDKQNQSDGRIRFTKAQLLSLEADQIQHLIDYFHGYTLVSLPDEEIEFFEWLKKGDPLVWEDLWEGEEEPYLVSIDFLHHLAGEYGSFPICDLIDQDNYWFSVKHLKPKGNEALIDIVNLAEQGKSLNAEQEFLLQLSVKEQDIWHFCYRFNIPVEKMKKAIEELVYKGWIVHLPDRADLVKYIEV